MEEEICLPPQSINGVAFEYRVDIWSLGVVLYEMCTNKFPSKHDRDFQAGILQQLKWESMRYFKR